ncbi:hypothetical protein FO514_33550, partial [Bacillus cereus]|nr:hypothetical protein [Bacillus cereus]
EQMTRLGYAHTDGEQNGGVNTDNLTDFFVPEYAQQLMPVNVTMSRGNEYGHRAGMEIYGFQLLNETSGCSVDDV